MNGFNPRPIKWSARVGECANEVALNGPVPFHEAHPLGTTEELDKDREQPCVYLWMVGGKPLYVGQTLNFGRRCGEHLSDHRRGSVGREVAFHLELDHPVTVFVRYYPCDCPLDFEERELIARADPPLNVSRGNFGRGRECDRLCPRVRAALVAAKWDEARERKAQAAIDEWRASHPGLSEEDFTRSFVAAQRRRASGLPVE